MYKKSLLTIWITIFSLVGLSAQAPVAVTVSTKTVDVNGQTYYLHTVEKGQTLYSITKAYYIKASQIIRGSDKPDLQLGEILKIPQVKETKSAPSPNGSHIARSTQQLDTLYDPSLSPMDTVQRMNVYKRKSQRDTIHIACLMPMYLHEVDAFIPSAQSLQQRLQGLPKNLSFLSLYEGVLMALDSIPCPSMPIVLHTFDITDDYRTADSLVRSGKLASMDLIIGPLFLKGFKNVSIYAKTQHIPIINPLSDKNDYLYNNPYAFMLNVSKEKRIELICEYIVSENAHHDVIVAGDKVKDSLGMAQAYSHLAQGGVKKIRIVDITKGRVHQLDSLLKPTVGASVFFVGDAEVELTQAIQQMARMNKPYLSSFFTEQFPFFEKIDSEYLNKIRAHFVQSVYHDYQDSACINFEHRFYQKYASLPDRSAFVGYDMMRFAIEQLCLKNRNFFDDIESIDYRGIAMPIRFERRSSGGYENASSRILKMEYSNLIIVH